MMALGAVTMVFGLIAIGSPLLTGAVVSVIIGMVLLIAGIFELIAAFAADGWPAGILAFLGGALSILVAGLLIARPVVGSAVLTVILGIYFLIDGITRTASSFRMRPAAGWGLMLISGLLSILLAILIWDHWPLSGIWAVGVLVGIRILFTGAGMLFVGTAME
jgi:uncharacterized membrane protein HdeD (DUF308 family)